MAKNTGSKSKMSNAATAATVAGVAGLAAAAVGAYWLYGAKHAAKHRKMAASWMLRARAEVMDTVEKLGDIDKDTYLNIVDQVIKKYAAAHSSAADVAAMTREMKAAWTHIHAATKPAKKIATKIKKAVK